MEADTIDSIDFRQARFSLVLITRRCAMSWEKPEAKDISLAMECSSYSNADDFGVEEAPADPSFDF
jgi:hypothetical protein